MADLDTMIVAADSVKGQMSPEQTRTLVVIDDSDPYSKEIMAEPLGITTEAQKKTVTKKLFLRNIDNSWLPEFKLGENEYFTERDISLIVRAIKAGYRRHKRMANLSRRLAASLENSK